MHSLSTSHIKWSSRTPGYDHDRKVSILEDHANRNPHPQLVETHRTQVLTWIPGFLGEYEHLKVAQIAIRPALGLAIIAGLGGPTATTYMLSMRWDVANYSREKTKDFLDDLKAAVIWLTTEEKWDVPVSGFLEGLRDSQGDRD